MAFIDHFATIDDPRDPINRQHDFLDSLFLTVSAVLSGAEGWKDIKAFGDEKLDWLRQYRSFSNGIPVDDTIARGVRAIFVSASKNAIPGIFILEVPFIDYTL